MQHKRHIIFSLSCLAACAGHVHAFPFCSFVNQNHVNTIESTYSLEIELNDWIFDSGTGRVEASAVTASNYFNFTFGSCSVTEDGCSDTDFGAAGDSGVVDLTMASAFASSSSSSSCRLAGAAASISGEVAALSTSWDFTTTSGLRTTTQYFEGNGGNQNLHIYNGVEVGIALAGNALRLTAHREFAPLPSSVVPPQITRYLSIDVSFQFDPSRSDVGVGYAYYPSLPGAFGVPAGLVTWDPTTDEVATQGLFADENLVVSESSGTVRVTGVVIVTESLPTGSFDESFSNAVVTDGFQGFDGNVNGSASADGAPTINWTDRMDGFASVGSELGQPGYLPRADTNLDGVISIGDVIGFTALCGWSDFNDDGFLDFTDADDYTAAFGLGSPRADTNGDGFLDFTDTDDFTDQFGNCD